MEMRKEKADLEQLLNSLIEKGFIPFNIPCITNVSFLRRLWITSHQNDRDYKFDFSLRDLASKESWLWQFVCENGMIKRQKEETLIEFYDNLRWRTEIVYDDAEYEYRVIESALKDESELEDFLLNSIKLD